MRTKFAMALAIVAVCVTAAWASWDNEFQITDNELENYTGWTSAHKVVIGDGGVVHMVWYVGGDAYYKRYWPGEGWSEELKIGDGAGLHPWPGIALDANGTDVHVVWMSGRTSGKGKNKISDQTIYYRKCVVTGPGTGGWDETPTDLCVNVMNCWHRSYPCIASGASGQVVVTWKEVHQDGLPNVYFVVFRECLEGEWQDEEVIAGPATSGFQAYEPSIAADGDGNVFVSYTPSLGGSYFGHVFVTCRIDNGEWTTEDVTPGDDYFYHSVIEVNPQTGNPHVACMSTEIDGAEVRYVYHTYRTDDGWEDLGLISGDNEMAYRPHMFFTVDGAAHVVWDWRDSDLNYHGISYASCLYEGGTWTGPVPLTTVPDDLHAVLQADIAGGTDGTLLAIWTGRETIIQRKKEVTKQQIWGIYNTPEGDGGSAKPMALSLSCFELFPNPARPGRVAVHYSLPHAGQMTVTLVDISGRAVRTQEVTAEGLTGTASIDVRGLSSGVYVTRLGAGDMNVSKPLVIAR